MLRLRLPRCFRSNSEGTDEEERGGDSREGREKHEAREEHVVGALPDVVEHVINWRREEVEGGTEGDLMTWSFQQLPCKSKRESVAEEPVERLFI